MSVNPQIISVTTSLISCDDRGFLLGDGLFETIKIVDGKPEYLKEHVERLVAGARVLDIPFECHTAQIESKISELAVFPLSVARITLTRGSGPRGLNPPLDPKPNLYISVSEYHPLPDRPLKLFVSTIRRNEFSPSSQLKTLSYTDNILARIQALKNGADEALLLNTQGFVACAASGNIFIEKNGVLFTPPLSEGVLPGIMRAQILAHHPSEEKRLMLEDCRNAEAVYLCNSLIGMAKIDLS
jgi:branched-chain amino acid aminotransferase